MAPIVHSGFFLLRTPLMPVNTLFEINDQIAGNSISEAGEKIARAFSDPYFQEAIYLASPELYQQFRKWMEGQLVSTRDQDKMVLSLYKYLIRMCIRPTPYGLFAGCAMGSIGDYTGISLLEKEKYYKHTRLDTNFMTVISAGIAAVPEIREKLKFFNNSSLYRSGSAYRYAEYSLRENFRSYSIVTVTHSPYLEKVLVRSKKGAYIHELIEEITDDNTGPEMAADFIEECIGSQILVSELEPAVTGSEIQDSVENLLKKIQVTGPLLEKLNTIRELLASQEPGIEKYTRIRQLCADLSSLPAGKDLFQADLYLAARCNSIGQAAIDGITADIGRLSPLIRPNTNADLEDFIRRFRARYEDEEIPLPLALDSESGIGYGVYKGGNTDDCPLIKDIRITNEGKEAAVGWNKAERMKLAKFIRAIREDQHVITLTDEDLDQCRVDHPLAVFPDSHFIQGSILAASAEDIDKGNFKFDIRYANGPSGARLLARFCHGDPALLHQVQDYIRQEEDCAPHYIYAEIVHLPQARMGNILMRPQLRNYEIPYLASSSLPSDHQLPLDDLMVSLKGNEIHLRSIKFNRRVIPRLSAAHNFSTGLPIYKFLCDLQFLGTGNLNAWDWNILKDEPFLPRIEYGKIILSRASWRIALEDIPALQGSPEEHHAALRKFFQEKKIPLKILLAEGDNELLLDMDNILSTKILAAQLLKRKVVTLIEFITDLLDCFVTKDGDKYTNELCIPLMSRPSIPHISNGQPIVGHAVNTFPVKRKFTPGEEWLYVKIYCGTKTGDTLLTEYIHPLVRTLDQDDIIDKWFFIRYADPDYHLRIRFLPKKKECYASILDRIREFIPSLIASGHVYSFQTDTYNRELERYGPATIEHSESVFHCDSEAVINILAIVGELLDENLRWRSALVGVDRLLDDFHLALPEKQQLMEKLRGSFFKEFRGDRALEEDLRTHYKREGRIIQHYLDGDSMDVPGMEEIIAILDQRRSRIEPLAEKIKDLTTNGERNNLLISYIHMFLNRILLSSARQHELVIYNHMGKYYASGMARIHAGSKSEKL